MTEIQSLCAVCAWRENCNKKFSISGRSLRCADYVKDITIKDDDRKETLGVKGL
ncbi:MAG: hypothetical protein HQL06_17085 [Nitrospirae bacterium]|nr:hypothetical protein [Nitrospirota bacterium]